MDTKALRQKILDLAIRGKLVPQDPNDEPASVLLERIREQKKQMVKEGKLKAKDIKNDTIIFVGEDNLHYEKFTDGTVKCIEDEIPFELPEGWEWCRLNSIATFELGKTLDTAKNTGTYKPYLRSVNVRWNSIDLNDINCMKFEPDELSRYSIKKGDLLICEGGDVGRSCVWEKDKEMYYQNALHRVRFYMNINPYFYMYIMMYYANSGKLQEICKGVTIKHLTRTTLLTLLFPVPPQNESLNIINKILELDSLLQKLEENKNDISYLISCTKSKILDLAIRGKLVPQDPNDEPASALIERIRAEKEEMIKQGKIKRDKKESFIFRGDDNSYYENVGEKMIDISDELPFNIPDSWCWGKLKDIVIINPRNKLDDDMEAAFIPMPLIEDGYSGNHSFEIRKWKDIKSGFTHFKDGDVGIAKITPCFENRKSVVFKNLCNGYGAGTTELHVLRPYKDTILAEFLLVYAKSQRFIEDGKQTFSGAVGQQRIGKEYIETVYLPIPPLQEQQRIINHINNLFNYLNVIDIALS